MLQIVKRLLREDEGQGMVEYALIISLVSVVSLLILSNLGTKIKEVFTKVEGDLKTTT